MIEDYGIEVEVRGKIKGGYRLKVSFISIGMYVDGFRATESAKNRLGYWVQPPAQLVNGEWKTTVEFDKQSDFWKELERKCVEAVELEGDTKDTVYKPSDKDMEEPINLDDIDFFDEPPKAVSWMDPKDRRK